MDLVFYLNQFTEGAKQFYPICVLYHFIMSTLQDQVPRKTKQNLPKCQTFRFTKFTFMAGVAMLPVLSECCLYLHGPIIYFTMYNNHMYLTDVLSALSVGLWFMIRILLFGTLWIWYFQLLRTNSHKVPKSQSRSA